VVLVNLDELGGHWTLLDGERELAAGKRGPTRLGFAIHPRGKAWQVPDSGVTVSLQERDESASRLPPLCLHEH
jgi:hypothetical protein